MWKVGSKIANLPRFLPEVQSEYKVIPYAQQVAEPC